LPSLPVATGPYSADWKELGRSYTVPEWWRDAKFGAWSHCPNRATGMRAECICRAVTNMNTISKTSVIHQNTVTRTSAIIGRLTDGIPKR
ncbi:hypothetical protein ACFL6K_06755, partial [Candidatus Latescibacterota bacterium]